MIKIEDAARGLLAAALIGLAAGCGARWTREASGPGSSQASASGGSADAGKGPRLMFITNSNSDWWNAVEKGMQDGGEKFGAQVELKRNEGQPEGQIQAAGRRPQPAPTSRGWPSRCSRPSRPASPTRSRDLQKAGKIVIAIDSDGQPDARRAYIGTNNLKAGEAAGQAAARSGRRGARWRLRRHRLGRQRASSAGRASSRGRGRSSSQAEVFEDGGDQSRRQSNVRPRSASIPTSASCSASGRTTRPGSPRRSASLPELRKKVDRRHLRPRRAGRRLHRRGPDRRHASARTLTRWATLASGF